MQVFQAFGTVVQVSMIPNPTTGKHKGYGFIEFAQHEAAAQAIQVLNTSRSLLTLVGLF